MDTAHPLPAQTGGAASEAGPAALTPLRNQESLTTPAPALASRAPAEVGAAFALLPVELEVAIPVRDFRVRNLLALEAGQVIETQWGHSDDLPVAAGDVQLAWSEFEVVETALSVRLTRLA